MIIRWLIFAAVLALIFCLPISNLFIQRQSLASNEDPEFKAVSDILVNKCADCHTRDMAQYPFYFSLPLASGIMRGNIDRAQASFLLDKDKLSGKEQFNSFDVEKLISAMAKGNMPPLQYVLMHWDSALSEKEQKKLVSWIQKRSKEYDIRPIPTENFFKPDAAKAELGKHIFTDAAISGNGMLSCASCHNLSDSDQSAKSKSKMPSKLSYSTPTVLNAAYNFAQYWDARARDLNEQAAIAMENPNEMGSSWTKVIATLQNETQFSDDFKRTYSAGINKENVCNALAEYERTLLTPGSRFDKFLQGDQESLSLDEKEGFALFKKHECASCHAGPALGGLSLEKMGCVHEYFANDREPSKLNFGRFNVTHNNSDKYRFKVPNLRNVALRAPYFHDGSAKTLEEAVETMSRCQTNNPLSKDEIKKVCAFLRTLSAPFPAHN